MKRDILSRDIFSLGVSLILHAVALGAALWGTSHVKQVPEKAPFRWTVSLVKPPSHTSTETAVQTIPRIFQKESQKVSVSKLKPQSQPDPIHQRITRLTSVPTQQQVQRLKTKHSPVLQKKVVRMKSPIPSPPPIRRVAPKQKVSSESPSLKHMMIKRPTPPSTSSHLMRQTSLRNPQAMVKTPPSLKRKSSGQVVRPTSTMQEKKRIRKHRTPAAVQKPANRGQKVITAFSKSQQEPVVDQSHTRKISLQPNSQHIVETNAPLETLHFSPRKTKAIFSSPFSTKRIRNFQHILSTQQSEPENTLQKKVGKTVSTKPSPENEKVIHTIGHSQLTQSNLQQVTPGLVAPRKTSTLVQRKISQNQRPSTRYMTNHYGLIHKHSTKDVVHPVNSGLSPEILGFLRRLHERIQEVQEYPVLARQMGFEGTTTIKLILQDNGTASSLEVSQPSGYPLLDEAALNTIHKILPLVPPPMVAQNKLAIEVPIQFELR